MSMSEKTFAVGTISAGPGEKRFGVLEFAVDGEVYKLPLWLIHGSEPGPTLVVTGGVHGAEYASVAAALELGQGLDPKALRGRVIVVPVVNMPGFAARSIYVCPLDGKNPNRFFPGDAAGTASEQIADWVFRNIIRQADYFVDMHGGDMIEALEPFTIFFRSGDAATDAKSLELAEVFGIPLLVASVNPGSTIAAASMVGIPGILTESGGQGIWTDEQVADHTVGLDRLMRHLKMVPGEAPEAVPTALLEQFLWLRSEHEGFWYPLVGAGEKVEVGQVLGCVKDWEGQVLQIGVCPGAGTILFVVTSLVIHEGEPLFAVGV
jgi:predicted deacylase